MVEQRENCGVLFRNARKQKETQPDYTGSCNIGGKIYYISAWINEVNDRKYFSMAFNERIVDGNNNPVTYAPEEKR